MSRLGEAGETALGVAWWTATRAWGVILTAILVLAPLLLANMLLELVERVPATVALGIGVAGAYAMGLPPWDAEERIHFPIVVGGTAVSAVAWDLMRGSADVWTLFVVLTVAVAGWPVRRMAVRWLTR